MKLNVGIVVDNMTRGNCIPINSMRSSDDCYSLVHNIGTGAYIESDKANLTCLVVKVMICRVGNIRVKRDQGVRNLEDCGVSNLH